MVLLFRKTLGAFCYFHRRLSAAHSGREVLDALAEPVDRRGAFQPSKSTRIRHEMLRASSHTPFPQRRKAHALSCPPSAPAALTVHAEQERRPRAPRVRLVRLVKLRVGFACEERWPICACEVCVRGVVARKQTARTIRCVSVRAISLWRGLLCSRVPWRAISAHGPRRPTRLRRVRARQSLRTRLRGVRDQRRWFDAH